MNTVPNVLLIMADEFQSLAMSARGHPLVKTPALDRLAARGALFENAYTPSPICVPARAALATGRHVHRDGYWDNAIAYDGRIRSWMHDLSDAGYSPTSIGKLHFRSGDDPTGFVEEILPLHIANGIGQVWGAVRDPLPEQPHVGRMLGTVGAGQSKYNDYDMAVSERSARWIRDVDQSTPWMLSCSFVAPHFPLIAPQSYIDLYPPADMPMPSLRGESGYKGHPWLMRMTQFQDNDSEFASDEDRRQAISAYFALCTFVDDQIGRVLDALDESGQSQNTLVIFCSDHGETLGMRNRWGKSVLYGEATRIPLIVAGPGVAPGRRVKTPVSLIDVAPTICDAMRVPRREQGDGESMLALLNKADDPDRVTFSEYHAVASPSGAFMVANARWKYHQYVGYPSELFDLANDPLEEHNLSGQPDCVRVEAQMRAHLYSICDPELVDLAAKAAQNKLIAKYGGPIAALRVGPQGASPIAT